MLRILNVDEAPPQDSPSSEEEYEIVMGRRQMASLAFLVLVLIAVCSGAAYIAGKASATGEVVAAVTVRGAPAAAPVPATIPPDPPAPVIPDAEMKQAAAKAAASTTDDSQLFAEPIPGARYFQVGAVDRGVALILTEGLRTRGFNGFIASGPKENIYRVLVGPLRTSEEYQAVKEAVDRMGVNSFPRVFEKGNN